MAAQSGPSGDLTESLTTGLEEVLAWVTRRRGWLVTAALVLVVGTLGQALYARVMARHRTAATDAYAAALQLLDAPLEHELAEAEQAAKLEHKERRAALDARLHAQGQKSAAGTGPSEQAADEQAADDALDLESLQLAELEAEENEALAAKRRGPVFVDDAARQQAALAALALVAEDARSGPVRLLAGLEAAQAETRLGQPEKAAERLAKLWASTRQSDSLWPLLANRLATAYEGAGKEDEAIKVYGTLGQAGPRLLADEAGLQRARLLAKQGQSEAARLLLTDVQRQSQDAALQPEIRAALLTLPPSREEVATAAPPASGGEAQKGTP